MKGILFAKLSWLKRSPWTFILMTIMSVGFALIIGGSNVDKVEIPVYSELENDSFIIQQLKENDSFTLDFINGSEKELTDKIKRGNSELGLYLFEDHFEVVVGIHSPVVDLVERTVNHAYEKNDQYEMLQTSVANEKQAKLDLDQELKDAPAFDLTFKNIHNDEDWIYDNSLHPLFGFALFFVVYTIAFSVFQMLVEKKTGVWDRMILSPLRKWEMYSANFLYSFFVGYFQICMVFLIFRYLFHVDFHGHFMTALIVLIPYVLAIVSLSIFLTGIVKSVQHFNAIVPIIAVSMAMLGGAYWPLEIVESKIMLYLSNIIPIKYGLELLNGVTVYQLPLTSLLTPIAVLLLMSVLLTGLGIHFMERRYLS